MKSSVSAVGPCHRPSGSVAPVSKPNQLRPRSAIASLPAQMRGGLPPADSPRAYHVDVTVA